MGSNALFSMCYPPRHFQTLEFWGYNPGQKYMVHLENLLCFHHRRLFDNKSGSFPKLGPPPSPLIQCCFKGDTLSALTQHCTGGGGKEQWNCQKRPSVPLLLTRIVACMCHLGNHAVLGLICLTKKCQFSSWQVVSQQQACGYQCTTKAVPLYMYKCALRSQTNPWYTRIEHTQGLSESGLSIRQDKLLFDSRVLIACVFRHHFMKILWTKSAIFRFWG